MAKAKKAPSKLITVADIEQVTDLDKLEALSFRLGKQYEKAVPALDEVGMPEDPADEFIYWAIIGQVKGLYEEDLKIIEKKLGQSGSVVRAAAAEWEKWDRARLKAQEAIQFHVPIAQALAKQIIKLNRKANKEAAKKAPQEVIARNAAAKGRKKP